MEERNIKSQGVRRRRRQEANESIQGSIQSQIEEQKSLLQDNPSFSRRNRTFVTQEHKTDREKKNIYEDENRKKERKNGWLIAVIAFLLVLIIMVVLSWFMFPKQSEQFIWKIWPTDTPRSSPTVIPTSSFLLTQTPALSPSPTSIDSVVTSFNSPSPTPAITSVPFSSSITPIPIPTSASDILRESKNNADKGMLCQFCYSDGTMCLEHVLEGMELCQTHYSQLKNILGDR